MFAASSGSGATFYERKAKKCGAETLGASKLRALEDESANLKKLVDEATFGDAVLKDVAAENCSARRAAGACGARLQGSTAIAHAGVHLVFHLVTVDYVVGTDLCWIACARSNSSVSLGDCPGALNMTN